jgi:hypothetical protein
VIAVSLRSFALLVVAACAPTAAEPIYGEWTVSGHVEPDGSAMSAEQADGWRGSRLELSTRRVSILNNVCDTPSYGGWTLTRARFEEHYGVSPAKLGILGDDIRVVQLNCNKNVWRAPGNQLIVASRDRLVFLWDGVFFLVSRAE